MLRQLYDTFASKKDTTPVVNGKPSENQLQFSELRYRRLFETAQDGILILDADSGKIFDANPFLIKLLGYSDTELLGKQLWEIGVFKDIAGSKKAFLELQKKGYIRYKDLPLQTKDGRSIDVEFVSNVYMVGSQKVIQCNIRDITDRKIAEEKVRHTQAQLVQAQEIAKLGSWKLDIKTNRVEWSDEMYRIYGYPVGSFQVTLEKAMERVHPDDKLRIQNNLKTGITEFMPPSFIFPGVDYRIILPNKQVLIVHGEATVFSDSNGKPVTMVGIVQDITETKTAKERLEVSNSELEDSRKAMMNIMEDLEAARTLIEFEKVKDEAMLESIGEGLIAMDNNRKILIMNRAAEEMIGWKMKEMVGHTITDLPLEDETGHIVRLDKRPTSIALATGKTISSTYYFVKKDKTRFPVALNVTPIKLDGKIIGAVDIFRDITRELEIDKAKSEFVSLASHQLRTPLGIMKWYLEALENEEYIHKAPPQVRQYYDEICMSNERVLSLVRDLLSVSRIEQGRVKNVTKSIDLISVVRDIVDQMQIIARKKKVVLSLTTDHQKIPTIIIDILRFHEVVENLISNAIWYTKAEGKVEVVIRKETDTFFISVKDTGIGISRADQKKLFTKFFRAENAIGYNQEGSGLGLYVVKSYVEGWGGTITAESTEGKGSVFTISLPISQKRNDSETVTQSDLKEKRAQN